MVNLPAGNPLKLGLELNELDLPALLSGLEKEKFDGYICIAFALGNDLEEGILIFNGGRAVAAIYEFFRYNKLIQGDKALPIVMNAAAGTEGIVDIVKLSSEQVQLVLAFNENALLSAIPISKDLTRLIPGEPIARFQEDNAAESLASRINPEEEKESPAPQEREEVLSKYGISEAVQRGKKSSMELDEPPSSLFKDLFEDLPISKRKGGASSGPRTPLTKDRSNQSANDPLSLQPNEFEETASAVKEIKKEKKKGKKK